MTLVAAALWPAAALAHPATAESGDHAPVAWSFEPLVLTPILLAAVVYAAGVRRLWRQAGRARGIGVRQVAAYAGGIAALAAALLSPIDSLSGELFSVHMIQHELLMIVAAPLLVAGQPLVAALWALRGAGGAPAAGRALASAPARAAWQLLSAPAVVWLLHAVALWTWHVPALYEAALANEALHGLEHASFFLTALLFWWGLGHGRYGRLGYGAAVIYLFTTAMHTGLLGAALTFAPRIWYPHQVVNAAHWGWAALEDQQLAGLIMWIPASLVFTGMALAYFASWLHEAERRTRERSGPARSG